MQHLSIWLIRVDLVWFGAVCAIGGAAYVLRLGWLHFTGREAFQLDRYDIEQQMVLFLPFGSILLFVAITRPPGAASDPVELWLVTLGGSVLLIVLVISTACVLMAVVLRWKQGRHTHETDPLPHQADKR